MRYVHHMPQIMEQGRLETLCVIHRKGWFDISGDVLEKGMPSRMRTRPLTVIWIGAALAFLVRVWS
jgi:hypothetical protein